ncbi:class I SAM-dependent methyltransferase [Mangrovihabitans endophyticus]|nr:methyltransferase [Mangrovihabitans endophyticus]
MHTARGYDELVGEAATVPIVGWEFAWLDGRVDGGDPSWSYPGLARALLRHAHTVLDLDTGGGELLAELAPLPAGTVAVETWTPNIPVARDRLVPYGVEVRTEMPAGEDEFDLVLSRHGRLPADDIARLLAPGGTLLTQQVGSDDLADLNETLGAPPLHLRRWNAGVAVQSLEEAGLEIADVQEERIPVRFRDVGAIVYQLRAVPWQVRNFDLHRYERRLRRLDAEIRAVGHFTAYAHRFLIEARHA